MLVYVDDIVIIEDCQREVKNYVDLVYQKKLCRDLGEMNFFLGLECIKLEDSIVLSQRWYIVEILTKFEMNESTPSKTQMRGSPKLSKEVEKMLEEPTIYRSILTRHNYIFCKSIESIFTSPN